jgi:hypothetical protein
MCGRFALFGNGRFGYESLHLPEPPHFENYNITPSQGILATRSSLSLASMNMPFFIGA